MGSMAILTRLIPIQERGISFGCFELFFINLTMFYSFNVYISPLLLGLFLVCFVFFDPILNGIKKNSLSDTSLLKKCNIFLYMTHIQHTHMHIYSQTLLIILTKLFIASCEQSFMTYKNVNVFYNIIMYKGNPLLERYIERYDTII